MFCNGADDAVVAGMPCTAPVVGIGLVGAFVGTEVGRDFFCGWFEIREKEWVVGHEFMEGLLGVMMPTGCVDVERHGDIVWCIEADGFE